MKSVIVKARPLRCEIIDVPIPEPGPDEVLIKVIYCASNPRDWKAPDHLIPGVEINQGNEMSGVIEVVGSNVYEFRKGDRVAAAHPMQTENGTYAEYATAPVNTCFLLPPNISFEGKCLIGDSTCWQWFAHSRYRGLYHTVCLMYSSHWIIPTSQNTVSDISRELTCSNSAHCLWRKFFHWSLYTETSKDGTLRKGHCSMWIW